MPELLHIYSMEALVMVQFKRVFSVAAVSLLMTGCVSQEKYNALKLERDGLAAQFQDADSRAGAAARERDAFKDMLDKLGANGNNMQALVTNLTGQNATLQAQLDELNRKYADALNRSPSAGNPLPQALTNELTAFAAANPDLVEFDAARGIVKFKSDVTFATGDAELQPKAKDAINRFAAILNSSSAASYELLIAGHTDNTPVVNPATKAKGHKDNWYLSSHRAISVAAELIGQRVGQQRIGVVGYADQRPAASNASESGKAQNRRVEVLILPTTVRSAPVGSGSSKSAKPAQNKDSAPVAPAMQSKDTAPAMSK